MQEISEIDFIKNIKVSVPYLYNLPAVMSLISLDPLRIEKLIAFLEPDSCTKYNALDLIKVKDDFFATNFRSDLFSQKKLILIANFLDLTVAQQKSLKEQILPLDSYTKVIVLGENKFFPSLTLLPLAGQKLNQYLITELEKIEIKDDNLILANLSKTYHSNPTNFARFFERFAIEYDQDRKMDYLFEDRDTKSLDLTAQLILRNKTGIDSALQCLKNDGFHPLQITSFLSKNFRTLLVNLSSWSPKELNNRWFLSKLPKVSNEFYILNILSELSKLDLLLKGSKLDSWSELKNYCYRISVTK